MNEILNVKRLNADRGSGIILPVFSLPSAYGIGTFGQAARDFVNWLVEAGQKYWQVLPLGPTSYGDSPYQSFSSFAGNPYFIDFDLLIEDGYLTEEEVKDFPVITDPQRVDYGMQYQARERILRKAFRHAQERGERFEMQHPDVDEYCRYMTIKMAFDGKPWSCWPQELRDPRSMAVTNFLADHEEDYAYHSFVQALFLKQYFALKEYANKRGIQIIGDIPIYVAADSSDTWAHQDDFLLKDDLPTVVGGCPPDGFSEDGQLWGNPIYDWSAMRERNYAFFVERLGYQLKLYDVLRIDHFRGFESFWEIPYGDTNARRGRWVKGPGYELFAAFKEKYPQGRIIAEDLGYMTTQVMALRDATGYPGMKVLQFAFNPDDESDYLPHNCSTNWVMYTGTHDNDTLTAWLKNAPEREKQFAKDYLALNEKEGYECGIIRGAWSSVCALSICQMQDLLGLGEEARTNAPNTLNNWTFRIKKEHLDSELAKRLYELTRRYGRLPDRIA